MLIGTIICGAGVMMALFAPLPAWMRVSAIAIGLILCRLDS